MLYLTLTLLHAQASGQTLGGFVESALEMERQQRRRRREFLWVIGVVGYTVLRFIVAYETLRKYGLNIWLFGFIDIVTAVPYAVGTSRLATTLIDRRLKQASGWAIVAAATFLAPYLYIALAGGPKGLDPTIYIVLALLVICLGANATWGVIRRVRAGRAVRPVQSPPVPTAA